MNGDNQLTKNIFKTFKKLINNKGMTIVEMLVSMVIMGIVAVCAFSLLYMGTKTYQSVKISSDLQFDSQIAMAQFQEYSINCNKEISWDDDDKALTVVINEREKGKRNPQLIIKEYDFILKDGVITLEDQILMKHVETFNVEFLDRTNEINSSGDVIVHADSITVELGLLMGDKRYNSKQTFALRNSPLLK